MERFWEKVHMRQGNGCWEWTAAKNNHGYGQFWWRGVMASAHRVSWEMARGPIQRGLCILHACDNPSCVNPDHLFLGTHAENMADKVSKGRQSRNGMQGGSHPAAKLTESDVIAIRSDLRFEREIAQAHGVSRATVGQIKRRERWGHVA